MEMAFHGIREVENYFAPLLHRFKTRSEWKQIHASVITHGLSQSSFIVTKMVDLCDKIGDIEYATRLFNHVSNPNVFLYNSIIRAYTHNSLYPSVIRIYKQMLANSLEFPDRFTFPFVFKSCASVSRSVHFPFRVQIMRKPRVVLLGEASSRSPLQIRA